MFWDNFIKICKEKGLKPTPVIKASGLPSSSIARWQGGAAPNGASLVKLAKYLNCSIDFLLTGSEFTKSGEKEVTYEEQKMLDMFRHLPEISQEFIFTSIEAAYQKAIRASIER